MYVSVSKVNDFNTSRIIYKQLLFESDGITPKTLVDVSINTDYIINGASSVSLPANFPVGVTNGFRLNLLLNNKTYEFVSGATDIPDNVFIFAGTSGVWKLVNNNLLLENLVTCTKEIYQVTDNELISSSLESSFSTSVRIKYYIINNSGVSLSAAELILNSFLSDPSILVKFNVKVLGYLNLSTYVLDTTGISYVNTTITYPDTKIQLLKALPNNSAFVLEVTPNVTNSPEVTLGTYISLYPKLVDYTIVNEVKFYESPVTDIATLKALPASVISPGQVRLVRSVSGLFLFNETSNAADNGSTVLLPNYNPSVGRWIIIQSSIQPGSITQDKLSSDVLALFNAGIKTTFIDIALSGTVSTDLGLSPDYDYYIINTPTNDGSVTTLNFTSSTATTISTTAILLELRQKSGVVIFDSSISFPSGNVPTLSGNGKTDLFAVILVKDSLNVLKKRAFLLQKDIG